MRRALSLLQTWGPWVAIGLLLWREQTLEQAISRWVAASNEALQSALAGVTEQAHDAVEEAAAQRGGGPVWSP